MFLIFYEVIVELQ